MRLIAQKNGFHALITRQKTRIRFCELFLKNKKWDLSATKQNIWKTLLFFHHRGDLFDFGGVKKFPDKDKKVNILFPKKFGIRRKIEQENEW